MDSKAIWTVQTVGHFMGTSCLLGLGGISVEKALAPQVTQPDREVLPAHTALSEVYLFTIP